MSIFSVSVGLWSESLSPDEMTVLAGVEPTRSHTKGDRRSRRMPPSAIWDYSYWTRSSDVKPDTWTLEPHWPSIAPILESLAAHDLSGVQVKLSIGTNARGTGFAFDLEPHHIALLHRAQCSVWIDSYEPNFDTEDLPDDYPYGGTRRPPGAWRRLRRRVNAAIRSVNPFGKMRTHALKKPRRADTQRTRAQ